MGLTFGRSFAEKPLSDLRQGDLFVLPDGGGHYLCLKGGTEEESLFAVLATHGVQSAYEGPGWFYATAFPPRAIYPIDELELRFSPRAFNLPTPAEPTNGAIAIDSDGQHWLYLREKGRGTVQYVNLGNGEFRPTIGPRSFFPKWRLYWRHDKDTPSVVVADSGYAT